MALIKCKECGSSISDKADKCPICGAPVPKHSSAGTLVLLVIIGFAIVMYYSSGDDDGSASSSSKPTPTCKSDDLKCLVNDGGGFVGASVYCKAPVEKLASHDMKWTDGTFESKFSQANWAPEGKGAIRYFGDKAKFQNGFGAYTNVVYACDLALDNKTVLNVQIMSEGYLPSD